MSQSIVEIIRTMNVHSTQGASPAEIEAAQAALGLRFADDYIAYTAAYGVISGSGVEWSGVTTIARLNVVNMTQQERAAGSNITPEMYVVENLGIEGVVAAQDHTGTVYWLSPGKQPERAYGSLAEYLCSFER